MDILPATGTLISVESLPAFPPRMRKSDFGTQPEDHYSSVSNVLTAHAWLNSRKSMEGGKSSGINGRRTVFRPLTPAAERVLYGAYGHRNSSVCNDELLSEMTVSVAGCTLLKMNADNS